MYQTFLDIDPLHFHILLHRGFLLEYLAPSVVEHIPSPNPVLVFPFGTFDLLQSMQIFATNKLWSDLS
jgi:hypothetical protein